MQSSTKTVLFFIACVLCVSLTTASYTGTLAYLTSGCTGTAAGGQAEYNTCVQNSTNVWIINNCTANGGVQTWKCSTSDCNPANCTLFETLGSCVAQSPYYLQYVCYANASVVPDVVGNPLMWSISAFGDSTCTFLVDRFWAPVGTCVAGFPDDASSTLASCLNTGLSLATYNDSMTCTTAKSTEVYPPGCNPEGPDESIRGVCTAVATTTATGATIAAATTGSSITTGNHTTGGATTGGSTGTGTGTGGSTTGTTAAATGTTTTTSSASVLAASTLLFVAVVFAAL